MNPIYICGFGAVSPAGWGVEPLRAALAADAPLPSANIAPAAHARTLKSRQVPPPQLRPAFLNNPRLRRSSPITHYAAAAAKEALSRISEEELNTLRLGLICCFQSGCVQYSCRFFEETLKDPASASPLVFPETVFAAPTSHIAAVLGKVTLASSLVGDPATFLYGVAMGADWLARGRVDLCIVVGAEENHWLLAHALWHFQHRSVFTSGAGAVAMSTNAKYSTGVELKGITDPHTFSSSQSRQPAALQMRSQLPLGSTQDLLVDGLYSSPRTDAPERAAWQTWPGQRLSPKRILGEGLMASAAWQCVVACDAIATRRSPSALVSLVGCNQQAVGAHFGSHQVPASP